MNYKSFLSCVLCTFLLFSCDSNQYAEKIVGSWEVTNWVEKTTGKAINNKMKFTFYDNERYAVDYGNVLEEGKFWFEGNDLYTVEDGKQMKKVLITSFGDDVIVFEMNRAGSIEQVTITRKSLPSE